METCSSLSLLFLLLLGLSQAIPLQNEETREEIIVIDQQAKDVDMGSRILAANKGSNEMLLSQAISPEKEEIIIIDQQAEDVDMGSRILAANKGSNEILLSQTISPEMEEIREEIVIIDQQVEDVDIGSRILAANKGSNEMLLEGDLIVPKTRNAMICMSKNCFWPKSSNGSVMVPYTISSEFSSQQTSLITSAMGMFHTRTCIRFKPRQNEIDYISYESKSGCHSALGHVGGGQVLSLSKNGCVYYGVIQHETLHALGFLHEHTRSDRDQYVRINWQNILPNMSFNFQKQQTNNLNTPYDYSSVMHYGSKAFSIAPGEDTITPIPDPDVKIGQRTGMSETDILRINRLYNC